jgi:hypothetical protein
MGIGCLAGRRILGGLERRRNYLFSTIEWHGLCSHKESEQQV